MATPTYETLLLKGTSISPEQLESMLELKSNDNTIRSQLLENSYTTPEAVLEDLCKHMNVEFMKDIPVNDIAIDLVRDIPINYAKQHEVIPFKEDSEALQVLTSNPLEHKAIDDMRVMFNKNVTPIEIGRAHA